MAIIDAGKVSLQPSNFLKKQLSTEQLLRLLKDNNVIKDFSIKDDNITLKLDDKEIKI